MARKPVDIGALGNDGTGDSIRDAFRKVNDNFQELYGSLGLGERLSFLGLDETPDSYEGQENSVLAVNPNNSALVFKRILGGSGITITNTPTQISIASQFAAISGDPDPQLGGDLSAQYSGQQFRILDLAVPTASDEVSNKSYTDTKISLAGVDAIDPAGNVATSAFGTMTGPLILSRDPQTSDDETYGGLIAATKRYVDASAFGSVANLYVAKSGQDARVGVSDELQGRALAYAYFTVEAALKRAEELINDSRLEIGPYKKVLTYDDGQFDCTLSKIEPSPLSGLGFTGDTYVSVDSSQINFGGTLYLPGDIISLFGGIGSAARFEVLSVDAFEGSNGRGTVLTYKTLSAGKYSTMPGSIGASFRTVTTTATNSTGGSTIGGGAIFNVTFNVNSVTIGTGGSGYTLVSVRFTGGGGSGAFGTATVLSGAIDTITITDRGTGFYSGMPTCVVDLPRFFIFTNGLRTDFTGNVLTNDPEAVRGRDIREGLYLYGETSGALAQILAHDGSLDMSSPGSPNDELFDVDIVYGSFVPGEKIAYGDISRNTQISVFIESGIYEENLPLKIPQNVAVIGDEFRRTIIRPKPGVSTSPWAFTNFRRDRVIDGLQTSVQLFGHHYLEDPTQPVYPPQNNKGGFTSAAQLLSLNKQFIQNEVIGWIEYQIDNNIAPFTSSFVYNANTCKRDVGLIIDALAFDLKYGDYNRSVSAALKYRSNASGLLAITTQLDETKAAINRIDFLAQRITQNIDITETFTSSTQIADAAYQAETGSGGIAVNITAVDLTNPVRLTVSGIHTYADKEKIAITGINVLSTAELNGNTYYVKRVSGAGNGNKIDLYSDFDLTTSIDGSAFTAYINGSGGTVTPQGGAIGILIDLMIDIIEDATAANYPLDNRDLDVFLCNDAVIGRAMTLQGHGGFGVVLDPQGQILAKSPYFQEGAVFSRSTGYQKFTGGMFVDGFTGNLQFRITSKTSNTRINVSGLIRAPQLPCSFIVSDVVYRINYLRQFIYNPGGSTAQFELDETTPYTAAVGTVVCVFSGAPSTAVITSVGHALQAGATLRFTSSTTLPGGLDSTLDYYVLQAGKTANTFRISDQPDGAPLSFTTNGSGTIRYERIYEVIMPGNRSMLSNDFTQVCDMGYGLVATNGGLTEAVSMFTYYCHISYYSINGAQIRSVGGSSAHGNFALVAEGADPLEVPTPVSIYHDLGQVLAVVATPSPYANTAGGTTLTVTWSDHLPLPGTELEINHNGSIQRYSISTVTSLNDVQKLARLNIATSGGLQQSVANGTKVIVRVNQYVVLTGDVVDVATRPSTALRLTDSSDVYRVLDFANYNQDYDLEIFTVTAMSIANECVITTSINHRQQVGYQVVFFRSLVGDTVPTPIDANLDPDLSTVYYVTQVVGDTQFKISAVDGGTPVNTSASVAVLSGTVIMRPYGLALTQLRENYNYVELGVYGVQPFILPSPPTCTITAGSPGEVNLVSHGFLPGTQVKFNTSGTLPSGLTADTYYWVVTKDIGANTFKIATVAPIDSTLIGIGGTLSTNSISGLNATNNITVGSRLVPRANITSVTGVSSATTATLTFTQQIRPPYLAGQSVTVSGFSGGDVSLNGTKTVIACTTTTVSYANAVVLASASGGTIAVVATGSLGTDPTVATIVNSTTITISSTGPANGSVVFDIEGIEHNITTAGSGTLQVGKVIGGQTSTTLAISDPPGTDVTRITNGIASGDFYVFLHDGTTYSVTQLQTKTQLGLPYALVTVSPAFDISAVSFNSSVTYKAGIPVYSSYGEGTLTIRIALTRVTSHDLLEIGTGSYADTNYPNEIYGPAVNSINNVPVSSTTQDNDGNTILRAQTQERGSGRVFFVTTDQFGNFNVGPFFKVDQGTGTVTFSASLSLSQLDGLGFKRGTTISEFSNEDSMSDPQQDTVPTEAAVVGYVERRLGTYAASGNAVPESSRIPVSGGFMALSGALNWIGPNPMDMNNYRTINLADPVGPQDAVNLRSLTLDNFVDFDLVDVRGGDLPVFTGVGAGIENAEVSSLGDIILGLDSTAHTVSLTVQNNKIVNSQINSAAAIEQSKLALENAYVTKTSSYAVTATGTGATATLTFGAVFAAAPFVAGNKITVSGLSVAGYNGTHTVVTCSATTLTYNSTASGSASGGTVSPVKGIAVFDSDQFTTVDGFASLKANGVAVGKIAEISAKSALANNNAGVNSVSAVAFTTIVNEGGAIKKNQFSTQGFLRRKELSTTNTEDIDYEVVAGVDNAGTASSVVLRDSSGNITVNRLRLMDNPGSTPNAAKTVMEMDVAGSYTKIYGYLGNTASPGAVYIGDGVASISKKTLFYNESHIFYTQNGLSKSPIQTGSIIAEGSVTTTGLVAGGGGGTATVSGIFTLNVGARFQATYADLAEYYEGDLEYAVGTVLVFGGDKEVTVSNIQGDHRVAGVVSENAGYVMNIACPGLKNLVALQGRVPCKVVGKIEKGDLMITSRISGVAISANGKADAGTIIGKALESYNSDHIGTIEIAVGRA